MSADTTAQARQVTGSNLTGALEGPGNVRGAPVGLAAAVGRARRLPPGHPVRRRVLTAIKQPTSGEITDDQNPTASKLSTLAFLHHLNRDSLDGVQQQ